ncbi:MAG: hypothetical protein F4X83_00230 [Chloroflexi bacterium]|nr:hypothetical protein [Chloroflexota bacterium]
MNKVVVNIKVDQETKKAAQALANDLGLTLSGLVNAQLKQLVRQQQLVLYATYPEQPMSPKLEAELDQVYGEIERGDVSQPHASLDSFLDDLNQLPSE